MKRGERQRDHTNARLNAKRKTDRELRRKGFATRLRMHACVYSWNPELSPLAEYLALDEYLAL
jgi:hypothetical protein